MQPFVPTSAADSIPSTNGDDVANYAVQFGQDNKAIPSGALRIVGKGTLGINDAQVVVTGKRKRLFWAGEVRRAFDRAQVINVQRTDKTIRFDVLGTAEKNLFVEFKAEQAWIAEQIVSRLPTVCSAEFALQQAERSDFHARLDALSPGAPVTMALVAANVAIFVAMCIAGVGVFQPDGAAVVRWGSNFGPLTMGGQWWRLLTAMFLHFGLLHVAFNMWALFQSGRMIERLFGSARFLALYLVAGLAGSMASLLWNPQVNSAGASGAIFGIFGGMLAFVSNPRNAVPASIMTEHRNSTLLFAGYSLFYGFAHTGIDNAAHIGGLLGGLVMGFLLARPLDAASRGQPNARRLGLATLGGFLLLGLTWLPLLHPSTKVQHEQQFQKVLVAFEGEESEAVDAGQHLVELGKTNAISKAEFSVRMKRDVLPLWRQPYEEISAVALQPDDKQYGMQQALLRYLMSRRTSLEMFADAVANDDNTLMAKASLARDQSDKALQEVQEIAKGQ